MADGPWIRFFPSDWLAGTRGLSAAETGIYITLIAMMYERGEPLHNETARLARLCGTTTSSMKKTLDVLMDGGKISVVDGGLWNDRVGVETENRLEKSQSAREKADKRWRKRQQKQAKPDTTAKPQQSHSNANHSYSHISSSLRSEDAREREPIPPWEFDDEIWPAFPNKVGKRDARIEYLEARKRASKQDIINGIKRYAAKTDDRPWCNPATFFREDRWEDQPASKPNGGGKRTASNVLSDLAKDMRTHDAGRTDRPAIADAGRVSGDGE